MNKYAAVAAIVMFALGAVAGHSMTLRCPATPAANAALAGLGVRPDADPAPSMPDQTSDQAV